MKGMMVFIQEVTKRLTEEISQKSTSGTEFELKDVFGKFSMDTLASCAFGVDAQSFSSSGKMGVLPTLQCCQLLKPDF
jgi:hypothetical protein